MLFDNREYDIEELYSPLFNDKKVTVLLARFDKIHPVVSGNKLFKLHYFLEDSLLNGSKPVLTFGGAWSNHLVATAFACKKAGIPCIGIVRGEEPVTWSQSLMDCKAYGMTLYFIPRSVYRDGDRSSICEMLDLRESDHIIVPEGGFHPLGAKGAGIMMNNISAARATHIITAVGTATTLAGLLLNRQNHECIIGVPVLRNLDDIMDRLQKLGLPGDQEGLAIFDEYHFGGYAKISGSLAAFMNTFYNDHHVPTDFVYTAKMLYAVMDKINEGYFAEGSKIICLHTGGLQGNRSLQPGTLVFN